MALSILALLVAPTIWIVDAANGPGTNFTDLPAAVAAAASGDTILVRSGQYSTFQVVGKALTIRGAGRATTSVVQLSAGATTTIRQVPVGQTFYLGGLRFAPTASLSAPTGAWIGAVQVDTANAVIADCVVNAPVRPAQPVLMDALVLAQATVSVVRSEFTGGIIPAFGDIGTSGCVATNSTLVATNCRFTGANGTGGLGQFGGAGDGLFLDNSRAVLHGCSCSGGTTNTLSGAHGVSLNQTSSAHIAGDSIAVLAGGTGPRGPGSAIFADSTSSALVFGNPTLIAQPGGSATVGAVTLGAPRLPRLALLAPRTVAGEILVGSALTVFADGAVPLAPMVLGFDSALSYSVAFEPLTAGPVLLPISAFAYAAVLDPNGWFAHSFPGSIQPAILGAPVLAQAAVFDLANGRIRMSNLEINLHTN